MGPHNLAEDVGLVALVKRPTPVLSGPMHAVDTMPIID
jgi:hypothetical protein